MKLSDADWELIKATLNKVREETLSRSEHADLTALVGRIEAPESEKPVVFSDARMMHGPDPMPTLGHYRWTGINNLIRGGS